MTGKELLLVLAGSAAAAGAAGVGAAMVVSGGDAPSGDTDAILARLDDLDRSLAGTGEKLDQNLEAVADLSERVAAVELGAASRPGRVDIRRAAGKGAGGGRAAHAFGADGASVTVQDGDDVTTLLGREGEVVEANAALEKAMKKLETRLAGDIGGRFVTALGNDLQTVEFGGLMKGLKESFELRKLPEAERWAKAQEDLGLTLNQVDELKAAAAERDEALEKAMQIEKNESHEGGHLTIKRMDWQAAKTANDAYAKRVDNSLNDEQRKGWREKGYDRAFGKGSTGGNAVISISTSHTIERSSKSEDAQQE